MATTAPVEATTPKVEEPPLSDAIVEAKPVVSSTPAPPQENEPNALAIVTNDNAKDDSKGALDRDATLAKLGHEKTLCFIKAWLESQKAKVENKAQKRQSKVNSWENSKKASLEAQLKKMEDTNMNQVIESSTKAEYAEKIKNKAALVHKQAEEKRAVVEAKKGEEMLKVEEKADQYRTTGQVPKGFACFSA